MKAFIFAKALFLALMPANALGFQLSVDFTGDHYLIDTGTKDKIRSILAKMFSVYAEEFQLQYEVSFTVKLRLFDNFIAFKDYQRAFSTSRSNNGFYSLRRREGVIWKNTTQARMLSTILHEANHVMLRDRVRRSPYWIDEGLAEYFENATVVDGVLITKPQEHMDARMKEWVAGKSIMPLKAYLELSNKQWHAIDKTGQSMSRTIAWSLVTFLMSSDGGKQTLEHVLQTFTTQKHDKLSRVRVMDESFPGGIKALEAEWHRWVLEARETQRL